MSDRMETVSAGIPLESVGDGWILLRRVETAPKQGALANAAGLDAGTLSAFLNNKGAIRAANLRLLLKALNLKLVDADARCVRESTFRELTKLAGRVLTEQPQLVWEDE